MQIYKYRKKVLELKIAITEMKNSLEGLKGGFEQAAKITVNLNSDCSEPFLTQKEMFLTAVFFLLLEKHLFFWPAYSLCRQLAIMTGVWNREQCEFPPKQQSLFISVLCLLEPLLPSVMNQTMFASRAIHVACLKCSMHSWVLTILLAKNR